MDLCRNAKPCLRSQEKGKPFETKEKKNIGHTSHSISDFFEGARSVATVTAGTHPPVIRNFSVSDRKRWHPRRLGLRFASRLHKVGIAEVTRIYLDSPKLGFQFLQVGFRYVPGSGRESKEIKETSCSYQLHSSFEHPPAFQGERTPCTIFE